MLLSSFAETSSPRCAAFIRISTVILGRLGHNVDGTFYLYAVAQHSNSKAYWAIVAFHDQMMAFFTTAILWFDCQLSLFWKTVMRRNSNLTIFLFASKMNNFSQNKLLFLCGLCHAAVVFWVTFQLIYAPLKFNDGHRVTVSIESQSISINESLHREILTHAVTKPSNEIANDYFVSDWLDFC